MLSFAVPGSPPLHVKSSLEGECFSSCHQMERPSQEQSQSLVWMSWEQASPPVWIWEQEKLCKVRVTCISVTSILSMAFSPLDGGMLVMQNERQVCGHGAPGFKVCDLLKMGRKENQSRTKDLAYIHFHKSTLATLLSRRWVRRTWQKNKLTLLKKCNTG